MPSAKLRSLQPRQRPHRRNVRHLVGKEMQSRHHTTVVLIGRHLAVKAGVKRLQFGGHRLDLLLGRQSRDLLEPRLIRGRLRSGRRGRGRVDAKRHPETAAAVAEAGIEVLATSRAVVPRKEAPGASAQDTAPAVIGSFRIFRITFSVLLDTGRRTIARRCRPCRTGPTGSP